MIDRTLLRDLVKAVIAEIVRNKLESMPGLIDAQDISMPATPLKVWQAIQSAPAKMAAE